MRKVIFIALYLGLLSLIGYILAKNNANKPRSDYKCIPAAWNGWSCK